MFYKNVAHWQRWKFINKLHTTWDPLRFERHSFVWDKVESILAFQLFYLKVQSVILQPPPPLSLNFKSSLFILQLKPTRQVFVHLEYFQLFPQAAGGQQCQ